MKRNLNIGTQSGISEVLAIVIGVVVSLIVSVLLSAGLTNFVVNGTIKELSIGPYIFAIRMISVTVGCLIGAILIKGKYLLAIGAAALGYLAVMIGTGIVMYDESFKNVLSGVTSVLLGGVIACTVVLKPLKKTKVTTRYSR